VTSISLTKMRTTDLHAQLGYKAAISGVLATLVKDDPMNLRGCVHISMLVAATLPSAVSAQTATPNSKHRHHQYKLYDLGTLGGPASYYSAAGVGSQVLSGRGVVAGYGDTSSADPNYPMCWDEDCFQGRAFRWENGTSTDLGTLPGGANSAVSGLNARGWIAGFSQDGETDPVEIAPATHAVLWTEHSMIDLGTLGGFQSNAVSVNDFGQVVGFSTVDTTPDPFSFLGETTHTFLWQKGAMRDLGTLGGPDSFPGLGGINQQKDLVVGASYVNSTPNATTGLPTLDPFLWQDGTMLDLGTLGGTFGSASVANNKGQVMGLSNLAGDVTQHSFVWEAGVMTDLGSLGGPNVTANWLNDAGEIVGRSDRLTTGVFGAFYWKNGGMKFLGTVGSDPCSSARAINAHRQIVGSSSDCSYPLHAFLYENDGPMVDLNTLVKDRSGFRMLIAYNINERGEIAGTGVPSGCNNIDTCGHLFLLVPCDERHHGECESSEMLDVPSSPRAIPAAISKHKPSVGEARLDLKTEMKARFGARTRALDLTSTAAPIVSVSPARVTFAAQTINRTSAATTVTVKNTGTAVLTFGGFSITGTNASEFAQAHTCGASLAVGASCKINVTFTPAAFGTRSATLNLVDSAAGGGQNIPLSGIGTKIVLYPSVVHFGAVGIKASSLKEISVSVTGPSRGLIIRSFGISGTNSGAFSQTNNCPADLHVYQYCLFKITFRPLAIGNYTASFSISDDADGSPQSVLLTGRGTTAQLSATAFNFLGVSVGSSSTSKTVTLSNVGLAAITPLAITLAGINHSDFTETHTCGNSLAPGSNCAVTVTFKPTAAGPRVAALLFADDAFGSPQSVSLQGTGYAGACQPLGAHCSLSVTCCPGLVCISFSLTHVCIRAPSQFEPLPGEKITGGSIER
jgi:probable HAF family extracellular repeat protein